MSDSYKARIEDMPRLNDYLSEKLADPEFAEAYKEAKHEAAFAIELANIRKAKELTQEELSVLTGIKQPQIARYEKGTIPDRKQLTRLAYALKVRIIIEPDGRTRLQPVRANRRPSKATVVI